MEASDPPATVAHCADLQHRHRPDPVVGVREGGFQPAASGMYDLISELSVPDHPSSSSISDRRHDTCNIWINYQNVRGLRTKIDEFFLHAEDSMYDVIILTETGLDDRIHSLQLFGNSYSVFRCDRSAMNSEKRSFGGVLIAVDKQFPCTLFVPAHGRHLEQVCVRATIRSKKILLCAVYIPPDKSNDASVIDAHVASVREFCDDSCPDSTVVVCGDYNQPRIAWDICNGVIQHTNPAQLSASNATLIDGMDFLDLYQANLQRNYLGRVLDLVFCTSGSNVLVDSCEMPLIQPDSHHPPLVIKLPVSNCPASTPVYVSPSRQELNYRKIDFVALSAHLSSIDWTSLFESESVDIMTLRFCDAIRSWLTETLPFVKPPSAPAWGTSMLRHLKRLRNTYQRKHRKWRTVQTKYHFKRASEKYRRLNASLYKSYVLSVQANLRRNPKKFWSFVNSKRKSSAIPSEVFFNESTSSTESDACKLFATFFSSVFASDPVTAQTAENAVQNVPANCVDLDVFEITPEMIIAAAKKLKTSYSAGPDGIPAVIFCRCAVLLAEPLCCIFNKSFTSGKFPEVWKNSIMFPVFKSGDHSNVKNYRGITSLSAGSKLFELVVSAAIQRSTRHYISSDQHGFMSGRSVTTNLLDFTSSCINELECKAQVDVIYTDLKAAFDRINHRILLEKILRMGASRQFGFTGITCNYSLQEKQKSVRLSTRER
ncbi:uncharacterized protein LOC129720000 [Wyeomyia smithii]|uniref:uncharacterized protein LOC129720000 n=1 Tax=Wyeomyia smithii TaxID=174621 RepID=UPI00246813BC|nr:uncharacterized protein LOC129720000 [Wyeomyia smithii]